jgi:hypothetical protein
MVVSAQVIWFLALAGSGLLSARVARVWAARHDPIQTLVACGAAGLACMSLAAVYASAGA